jgi:hypothetical protein
MSHEAVKIHTAAKKIIDDIQNVLNGYKGERGAFKA